MKTTNYVLPRVDLPRVAPLLDPLPTLEALAPLLRQLVLGDHLSNGYDSLNDAIP